MPRGKPAAPGAPKPASRSKAGRRARILIVDDHPLIRRGLSELINRELDVEVCGEAATIAEALERVERLAPELALIDLQLEDGLGLELIKQIRARRPATRMLVLTMHDAALFAERAIQAGASGFLNKQEPAHEVLAAIRRVLEGGVYLPERFAGEALGRLLGRRSAVRHPMSPAAQRLSDREVEVMTLLGLGHTVKEIAVRLHLSAKTVDAHRDRLKRKLGLRSSTELLRYALALAMEPPGPGIPPGPEAAP
ncbi:MAG TPA: response regulator transcription factor [Gemmatimonadales bacterium]|jgi:DNA-binding NarL/FixJ family response regulator|nr:response regulator transcription factor [Gemmatimonadales bacterium]